VDEIVMKLFIREGYKLHAIQIERHLISTLKKSMHVEINFDPL
jgi:hypothetical protein